MKARRSTTKRGAEAAVDRGEGFAHDLHIEGIMKSLFALTVLCLSLLANVAQADRTCGGECVSTSKYKALQMVCGNSEGTEVSCRKFSMAGCEWKEFSKKNVRGSSCINGTKDRTLDNVCGAKVAQANDLACVKAAGCVYVPAAFTCEH